MPQGVVVFDVSIDKTPATGSYIDVDVSGDGVPVGATGVLLHYIETSGGDRQVYCRKNGSTDDQYLDGHVYRNGQSYFICPIDANRVFECKLEHAGLKVYVEGYTDSEVVLDTNATAIDDSGHAEDAWNDIDLTGVGSFSGHVMVIL